MTRTEKNDGSTPSTGPSSLSPDPQNPFAAKVDLEVSAPVRFRFRGRRYDAEVAPSAQGTVVRVVADAGCVPYSAESPELRRTLLKVLESPPVGIAVGPDQRILLRAEMPIEQPARPERVAATAAALAMALGSGGVLDRFAKFYDGTAESA